MKPSIQESDIQRDGGCASPDASVGAGRWRDTCLPPSMNRARSVTNRAFTLIELLVVVAIIAVLAAMLLPALSQAKSRAQTAIDLNNVHQIMMATHLYATDNNGYLPQPGAYYDIPSWCWSSPFPAPPDNKGTLTTYNTYYPKQVKSFHGLDSSGKPLPRNQACLFTPYLKNEKVLRCPADIPNTLMYQRQVYITSYCWSQVVEGNWSSPAVTIGSGSYYSTLKLSQFKADAILMYENDELNVTDVGAWNDTVSCADVGISGRHGKGATIGNADGSAERILLRDYYLMAANVPYKWNGGWWQGANRGQSMPNRVWCNPLFPHGSSVYGPPPP